MIDLKLDHLFGAIFQRIFSNEKNSVQSIEAVKKSKNIRTIDRELIMNVTRALKSAFALEANDLAAITVSTVVSLADTSEPDGANATNATGLFEHTPTIFDLGIVVVLGIVGNALVIYVVIRNSHMRTVTNIFIVNLAIGDFLVILLCLPPTIVNYMTGQWLFGQAMCKLFIYVQVRLKFGAILSFCPISNLIYIPFKIHLRSTSRLASAS